MKRIIFVIESMNIGGTEKALLSMISEIPKDKYDMTILMLENRGGFLGNTSQRTSCTRDYREKVYTSDKNFVLLWYIKDIWRL